MSEDTGHYRKLENMYKSAPINKLLDPQITVTKGTAEITVAAKNDFFHAAHALHGAIYFKMLDDASFFAVNSIVPDAFVLTTNFSLHFFRPIYGGTIRSKGSLLFATSKLFVAEATLWDESGEKAAYGSGTFVKSQKPLSAEIGYL